VSPGPLILAGLAALLCIASIVLIAVGGRDPPHRIRTFNQHSDAELEFERRTRRLRWSGGVSLVLAVAAAVIAVVLGLRLAFS
jgi:hypothetical protein